ncbi:hypothetical protein X809_38275 [Paenibacillus polymyxa CR1]|uniref:Uncharacterized protein n=1 Tax=Paenibacillus polymyxa TaxID=1406 RepID=A0ABX2ZK49_PAEPO|nr:hypothetical protein X809_38275 [Paenibacillus polymyxa CR1]APQ61326.1 hypothetical protein VK72_22905 [Paenibacillus polymyxa]OME64818.1 hypothetical protein BK119_26020 [Paenibacillus peoriae]ODA09210.1 hypothetical protein A7312_27000 [Paenibacillus polymyxa]ODB57959.1 hypothetical protein A7309_24190 [Paenibacillus polymyxa]
MYAYTPRSTNIQTRTRNEHLIDVGVPMASITSWMEDPIVNGAAPFFFKPIDTFKLWLILLHPMI